MSKQELDKLFLEFHKWVENENARLTHERERILDYRNRAMFPLAGERAPLPENIKPTFKHFMKFVEATK